MALKVWLNNSMQKIDTNLHKPVTFINGTKYKLDKAWTFVNGVKQQIWGESGVQIDYIKSDGVLGGGNVFAIGETWANVWNNKVVYRLNISNLNSPSVAQSLSWGNINHCSYYQSTNSTAIFATLDAQNKTGRKVAMSVSDGSMSVTQTATVTDSYSGTTGFSLFGMTNSFIVFDYSVLQQLRPSVIYTHNIYWNNVKKYSQDLMGMSYHPLVQTTSSTFLVGTSLSGASGYVVESFSETGYTSAGSLYGSGGTNMIYDNGNLFYTSINSSIGNIVKVAANDVSTVLYRLEAGENRKFYLFGKIDSYLYCLDLPTTSAANSVVKFKLLNASDLTVAFEKVLPNDPYNENSGLPTFWMNATCIPQVSHTGFVGLGTYTASTLGLRIARFSTIF